MILDAHALLWTDGNDSLLGLEDKAQIERIWRTRELAVSVIAYGVVDLFVIAISQSLDWPLDDG